MLSSGARVIETQSDTLHIPTVTADAAAAWVAEKAQNTPGDPTLEDETATPRKLAALVQMSNEVIEDSNPEIMRVVADNLVRSLSLKSHLGAFEGSGTPPEIRGLKNVSGISTVSMGTNGAALTNLDPFADAIGELAGDNARAGAIVMHARF